MKSISADMLTPIGELWQIGGDQLHRVLCASCHGVPHVIPLLFPSGHSHLQLLKFWHVRIKQQLRARVQLQSPLRESICHLINIEISQLRNLQEYLCSSK